MVPCDVTGQSRSRDAISCNTRSVVTAIFFYLWNFLYIFFSPFFSFYISSKKITFYRKIRRKRVRKVYKCRGGNKGKLRFITDVKMSAVAEVSHYFIILSSMVLIYIFLT